MITPPPPGGFFLATLPALKEEGAFLEPPTTADYESLGDPDKSVHKRKSPSRDNLRAKHWGE